MRKKNKYYISCGTGLNQLSFIQAAKSLGHQIVGIDQNINSEGMKLCDIKIEESILNFENIYKQLLKNLSPSEIIGGFSASYGEAIASWSHIVERLNLHGLTRPLTEILLDKLILREALKDLKKKNLIFDQPKFAPLEHYIILKKINQELNYPIILKPRNGHSKKNIFIIRNEKELNKMIHKSFFKKYNVNPRHMMLENYIPGDEITVVGFIQDFVFHLVFLSSKLTTPYPPFVEIEHSFPSVIQHLKKEIEEIHQKITDTLQIPCSPIVSEWKYHCGKLYLIELSPQIPGEYIGDYLIPRSLNYSYFSNLVKLTTGDQINLPSWRKAKLKKTYKVRYWLEKPHDQIWNQWKLKSDFCRIINKNPKFPPRDNSDRYGVAGFVS